MQISIKSKKNPTINSDQLIVIIMSRHLRKSILFYFSNVIPLSSFPSTTPYPLSPSPVSMRVLPDPLTHSCFSTLAFLYSGSIHRTKELPSQ